MTDEKRLAPRDLRPVRQQVIDRLSDGFAHDDLDVDEFERRVTLAHTAASGEELQRLIEDLPTPAAPPEPAVAPRMELVPIEHAPSSTKMVSVMGNSERHGRWAVPRRFKATTVMGTLVLDFREARFPSGPVDLRIRCVMGDVTIIVPPQLAVETSGSNVMGNFEHVDRAPTQYDPDAPVLRVDGLAVMGNVSVRMRLPGEDWRDEWRRLHDERMAEAAELARQRVALRAERHRNRLERRAKRHALPPADDDQT